MCWRSIRWQHLAWLSIILLLAAGVRLVNLSRNSLWTDEYLSLECSSGWARSDAALAGSATAAPDLITLKNARPISSIWSSIRSDENHPPLYFILLRIWRDLFGDSPTALRSLSVAASLIAMALLFGVGVYLHSPRAALWACLLMAVASPQIQQAQDARAYMPVTAVCLTGALALLRMDRQGPTLLGCAALLCAGLIAPLMHYMAFPSLAAMLIYAAFVMRGSSRKWALVSLAGSLAAFALLWGPPMVQQHYRMLDDTVWLVMDHADASGSVLQNLCSIPARLFLDLDMIQTPAAWLGAGALVMPLLVCRRIREMWFCWIWLIVPVGIALVIDLSTDRRSLSMIRYTLAAAPGIYLMLGLLAARVRNIGWVPAAVLAQLRQLHTKYFFPSN